MKKIHLSLMAIVFAGNLSYAQSPIYTTAGNGANYSADGAYLGWSISGSGGETNFVNNIGGGNIGGFTFDNTTRNNVTTRLMTILGGGNVGIGTATPNGNLQVKGTFITGGSNANLDPAIASMNPGYLAYSGQMLIGWNRTAGGGETDFMSNQAGGAPGGFAFYSYPNSGAESQLMWIQGNGQVRIGNTQGKQGDYMLAVAGSVIATSVTVKTVANWPDYVLKKEYQLPPLTEVKAYIDQNQHLPDLPSEQQVAKEGLNLGEMNKLLVKKVEELTLYLIEKDKELKAQNERLKKLEQKFSESKR
jgi:hypothetical protein